MNEKGMKLVTLQEHGPGKHAAKPFVLFHLLGETDGVNSERLCCSHRGRAALGQLLRPSSSGKLLEATRWVSERGRGASWAMRQLCLDLRS